MREIPFLRGGEKSPVLLARDFGGEARREAACDRAHAQRAGYAAANRRFCVHIPCSRWLPPPSSPRRGPGPRAPPAGSPRPVDLPISSSCASLLRESSSLGVGTAPARAPRAGAFARLAPLTPPARPPARPASPSATRASTPSPNPPCTRPNPPPRGFFFTRGGGARLRPPGGRARAPTPCATPSSPPEAISPPNPPPSTPIRASRASSPPRVPSLASPTSRSRTPTSSSASSPPPGSRPRPQVRGPAARRERPGPALLHPATRRELLRHARRRGRLSVAASRARARGRLEDPATVAGGLTSDASADASPDATAGIPPCTCPWVRIFARGGGEYARQAAAWGLEELPRMAEVYPLGGAGDRLGLQDEVTRRIPACASPSQRAYAHRGAASRSHHARESLCHKVHGTQHVTPVAVMTSAAKGRLHGAVSKLMEDNAVVRVHAEKEAFRLFSRPPWSPTVATRGGDAWCAETRRGRLAVALKPGGHGTNLETRLHDREASLPGSPPTDRRGLPPFARSHATPWRARDTTILALSAARRPRRTGTMGFASAASDTSARPGVSVNPRSVGTGSGTCSYGISNVERYTVLAQHGISDDPAAPGSTESRYRSRHQRPRTSVWRRSATRCSPPQREAFPGMLVEDLSPLRLASRTTAPRAVAWRLPCRTSRTSSPRVSEGSAWTRSEWETSQRSCCTPFAVASRLRRRRSTIRPRRTSRRPPAVLSWISSRTPRICSIGAGVKHPPPGAPWSSTSPRVPGSSSAPTRRSGPLWDVTEQKIRGGALADRAEVRLEVAEMQWENVSVSARCWWRRKAPLGADAGSALKFDDHACGRCRPPRRRDQRCGLDRRATSLGPPR